MNVLVIDDEEDILLMARMGLSAAGMHVSTATGGAEGLRLAAAGRPAIIVLDIMMPGMDGYDTLRALKADAATANIPVVVLTARTLGPDRDRLLELGAADIVAKPFHPRALVERLRSIMGRDTRRA